MDTHIGDSVRELMGFFKALSEYFQDGREEIFEKAQLDVVSYGCRKVHYDSSITGYQLINRLCNNSLKA